MIICAALWMDVNAGSTRISWSKTTIFAVRPRRRDAGTRRCFRYPRVR
jgi:hypothetical protein